MRIINDEVESDLAEIFDGKVCDMQLINEKINKLTGKMWFQLIYIYLLTSPFFFLRFQSKSYHSLKDIYKKSFLVRICKNIFRFINIFIFLTTKSMEEEHPLHVEDTNEEALSSKISTIRKGYIKDNFAE